MPPKSKPKASDQAALQALKQALKEGHPGPLYVLYGEETYLRDYYLRQLKAQLLPQVWRTSTSTRCSAATARWS